MGAGRREAYPLAEMPPETTWLPLVEAALAEDLGPGDATSDALLPAGLSGAGVIEARAALVVAGLPLARAVFGRLGVTCEALATEGAAVHAGSRVARVHGPARGILAGERTALNFLQRLSGIATWTRRHCEAAQGTRARIFDTRKTTPGWRTLEKYAVRCGGGHNHRVGLFDGVLIKDNHIAAIGSVSEAVKRARERAPVGLRIEVEVESLDQATDAIEAGAEALLIDNQPPEVIAKIVELAAGRIEVEASGGVGLGDVAAIAKTGVDRISIGGLTHSAPAADLALEWNAG